MPQHLLRTIMLLLLALATLPLVAHAEDEEIESTVDELAGEETAEEEPVAEKEVWDENNHPVCFITEERWDTSASKVEAIFADRGTLKRVRFLNLAYLVIGVKLFQENDLGLELKRVSVVEYPTFGTEQERMLELGLVDLDVWFVLSEQAIPGTKPPYIAAFATEEAAKEFAGNRESQILSYSDVMTKIIKNINAAEDRGEYDSAIDFSTN